MKKEDTVLDLMELTDKYIWRRLHRKVKESWKQRESIDQTRMDEWKVSRWRSGEWDGNHRSSRIKNMGLHGVV